MAVHCPSENGISVTRRHKEKKVSLLTKSLAEFLPGTQPSCRLRDLPPVLRLQSRGATTLLLILKHTLPTLSTSSNGDITITSLLERSRRTTTEGIQWIAIITRGTQTSMRGDTIHIVSLYVLWHVVFGSGGLFVAKWAVVGEGVDGACLMGAVGGLRPFSQAEAVIDVVGKGMESI